MLCKCKFISIKLQRFYLILATYVIHYVDEYAISSRKAISQTVIMQRMHYTEARYKNNKSFGYSRFHK